jgi:hypothetical protein
MSYFNATPTEPFACSVFGLCTGLVLRLYFPVRFCQMMQL